MYPSPLDSAARAVIALSPAAASGVPEPLGNHGGFSGARLWRVVTAEASFCLRAWPPDDPSPERLRRIHDLMAVARRAGLSFVPAPLAFADGTTFVARAGRLWELTPWMPGRAELENDPSPARVSAACRALAQLHDVWARLAPARGPCPAVARRLKRAEEWRRLVRSGWRPNFHPADSFAAPAERLWHLLPARVERVPTLLAPWVERELSLHPCLCDVWHAHVLFAEGRVSALLDYGAVKVDHPATDLARFLGSLRGDDTAVWRVGLDAYALLRPFGPEEEGLAHLLDRTGVVLTAANWLLWLYHERRVFEDIGRVTSRLAQVVARLESWP